MLILLTYRRAKAGKATTKRALDSGKILKKPQKKSNISNPSRKTSSSRTEEMQREVLEQERRRRSHSKASQEKWFRLSIMSFITLWQGCNASLL
ncbi:unnamed protein product [Trifolium pratense]|uniref:Uncharacterized protein n=1 Tax=Trifolium pratense TaxID=57577 RepID=A0ACB0JBT4_TRIPR|nr:unnamed protein product [Trifolium pratense]